ncbi:MAG TPA: NADH-quinone reductase [Glaciecola sp.]|jgi:hypothetical protein|nr:NADH-quinone reductase [Glaciecola sp.]
MAKFFFDKFYNQPVHIEYLEVQSFELSIYLVKLTVAGETSFVYDKNDNIMRFNSSQHIRDCFAACQVDHAILVHDSPYEEMIGNPPKSSETMAMPFSMTQPY